jgi:hypothetical protein
MIIFWPDLCFTRFQASDRLGALFGVSILEDNARAQLVVVCRVSNVKCDLQIFDWPSFEYISLKKSKRKSMVFVIFCIG